MNTETRAKYADYIAECLQMAANETGVEWPKDTILVVKTYSDLAELNEIIGMKIWVMDMPSSFDFFVAFPSNNVDCYKLQKVFKENLDCFTFDI